MCYWKSKCVVRLREQEPLPPALHLGHSFIAKHNYLSHVAEALRPTLVPVVINTVAPSFHPP